MKKTGIKATEEEVKELRELAARAASTPVILLGGTYNMSGEAWKRAEVRFHELALAHGLPEITGYYGMDADGEFVQA